MYKNVKVIDFTTKVMKNWKVEFQVRNKQNLTWENLELAMKGKPYERKLTLLIAVQNIVIRI